MFIWLSMHYLASINFILSEKTIFIFSWVLHVITCNIWRSLSWLGQPSEISVSWICTVCRINNRFLFHDISLDCNKNNTTVATSTTGTAYPSGASEFKLGYQWGSSCSIFNFLWIIACHIVPFLSILFDVWLPFPLWYPQTVLLLFLNTH